MVRYSEEDLGVREEELRRIYGILSNKNKVLLRTEDHCPLFAPEIERLIRGENP